MKKFILFFAAMAAVLCNFARADVSPGPWQRARTLKGAWGEGCIAYTAEGIATLKCSKANKHGMAKVSLKIKPFAGKTISYKAVTVNVSGGGDVVVKWGSKYSVTISSWGEFFGEPIYGDIRPSCSPNAVWSAALGGAMGGTHSIYFPYWKHGLCGDCYDYVDELCCEGSEFDFLNAVGMWAKWHGGVCVYYPMVQSMDSGLMFTASGRSWNFPLADDYPKMKVTYNSSTGEFKGSAKVTVGPYCMYVPNMKSKVKSLKIKGACVDGMLFGAATIKSFKTPIVGQ